MKSKVFFRVMLGMALAFGLVFIGCGDETDETDRTQTVIIKNESSRIIKKLEIVQGKDASGSATVNIAHGGTDTFSVTLSGEPSKVDGITGSGRIKATDSDNKAKSSEYLYFKAGGSSTFTFGDTGWQ